MKNKFKLLSFLILGSIFILNLISAYSVFILNDKSSYAENGVIENLQAVVLAISCITFLVLGLREKAPAKLILLFCTLLCYSFLLRELDVERLNVHEAFKVIGSGIGRNITLVIGFTAMAFFAASKFNLYKKAGIQFIKSKPGVLLLSAGMFLIIGDVFEKSRTVIHHVFFEESFELLGYCLILISALAVKFKAVSSSRP